MNKTAILLSGLLSAATAALAQGPVYSVNIVGIQKVSVDPNGLEMASNPFTKADSSVTSVLGTQFDGGLGPDEADKIYVFDSNSNGYKVYFLYFNAANSNDPLNNKWLDENYDEAVEPLSPGKGFFLSNNIGGATNTVSLVGDVVSTPQVTKTILPGLNQISYPYSTSISLNSMALKIANGAVGALGPDEADNIFIWSQSANTYVRYFLYNNSGNAADPLNNSWLDENYDVSVSVVQPGQAFFYQRLTTAPALNWVENKPY